MENCGEVRNLGAKDVSYQRQIEDGKTIYSVHYTTAEGKRLAVHIDEKGKVVEGPRPASEGISGKKGDSDKDADDNQTGVKYHHISDADVRREVPAGVLKSMDPITKGNTELYYQRQIRDDNKTYYSVHYTAADGKRMVVRTDEAGKIVSGPQESHATHKSGANPHFGEAPVTPGATPGATAADVKREEITAFQMPANVRKAVEDATKGGTDHKFIKETAGNTTNYFVEYTKNGQRTNIRVNSKGQLIEASPTNDATATATPTPTPVAQPQLASAKETAAGPYQTLSGADQLPAQVQQSIQKDTAGATDLIAERFTRGAQTLYGIHFTGPQGGRRFMAVDQSGKITIEPRKSGWQEGGKGVRFDVITADQLPAEVRTQIEQHTKGGSDHLFLARTEPSGQKSYLVQYTENGERMQLEVGPKGKLTEKPRKAQDQPFTAIEKKAEKR